jgi:hypothetical protein
LFGRISLARVGRVPQDPDIIVRQIMQPTSGVLKWARSATKHRISHDQSRYVIEHCGLCFRKSPPAGAPADADTRLVFLGDDTEGMALEVMAIKLVDGRSLVIHATPLGDRYREQYEEAERWRK